MKFKTGDTVKVIAGKDKGTESKIARVIPEQNRVIVEGVQKVKPQMVVKVEDPAAEKT